MSDCHLNKTNAYCLNLDPAVGILPYQANIDIRDTVNYKEVMKQYNLGPNGGILTALNLFATRFDQVLGYVDKRAPELDLVFLDTPGQIEIFTWSASGTIISESLASTYPTVILYVIDTPRTTAPVTFMSNMMYACRSDNKHTHGTTQRRWLAFAFAHHDSALCCSPSPSPDCQYSVQIQAPLPVGVQQDRHHVSRVRHQMDAGFRRVFGCAEE